MALEERFRKREQKESVGNDNERWPNTDNKHSRPSAERRCGCTWLFNASQRTSCRTPRRVNGTRLCVSQREKERERESVLRAFLFIHASNQANDRSSLSSFLRHTPARKSLGTVVTFVLELKNYWRRIIHFICFIISYLFASLLFNYENVYYAKYVSLGIVQLQRI